ncbi:MAG: hypothetical protein JWP52_2521 [Rhizobacter sp.]|nr:hypothetical protein [Rhizobacter sp.]
MTNLWPWLAIAGLGALHGLSPATGWMFAAASGIRAGNAAQARRALWPIGIGHAASTAVVAFAVVQGLSMDRALVQGLSGALLIAAASYRLLRGPGRCIAINAQAGHAGIALWSFLMATAHGAGLMLVPALVPLCLAGNPAREISASGSLLLAMAAVGVHTAAMLATTGVIASGVCRGFAMHPRLLSGAVPRQAWTAALAVTGIVLMALR